MVGRWWTMARRNKISTPFGARSQGRLRASVPASTFQLWLEPLKPVGAQGATLYLSAPDGIRAWTERRYSGLIREALGTRFGPE